MKFEDLVLLLLSTAFGAILGFILLWQWDKRKIEQLEKRIRKRAILGLFLEIAENKLIISGPLDIPLIDDAWRQLTGAGRIDLLEDTLYYGLEPLYSLIARNNRWLSYAGDTAIPTIRDEMCNRLNQGATLLAPLVEEVYKR